jgi:hypothetical protein
MEPGMRAQLPMVVTAWFALDLFLVLFPPLHWAASGADLVNMAGSGRQAMAAEMTVTAANQENRSMTEFYSDCHRRLQDLHQSRALADRLEEIIVHTAFTEDDIAFIAARDFFFLSTVDPDGQPTVSYKGGAPGFVTVQDNTLVFPCYDGKSGCCSSTSRRRAACASRASPASMQGSGAAPCRAPS